MKAQALYRDATMLAVSSALTAGLGIVFWVVAARVLPPERLGIETAVLSLITAPAIVIGSGVGDAFTAMLPHASRTRRVVLAHGYATVVVAGVVAGALAAGIGTALLPGTRDVWAAGWIAVGVATWALFILQDSALTGLGRAWWLPIENGLVSAAKIGLLPVAAIIGLAHPVVASTLLPALLAVAVLFVLMRRLAPPPHLVAPEGSPGGKPWASDPRCAVRHLRRFGGRTTAAVAMTMGSLTLLPFAVTAIAGPVQGAVFALCLSMVQALDFLAAALGVSLVVHASSHPARAHLMARSALARIAVLVALGGLVLWAVSPMLFRLLGPAYVALGGVSVVGLLCLGSLLRTVFIVWSALQRSRGHMRALLWLNGSAATTLYLLLPWAAGRWGALGAAAALLTAQGVLSVGAAGHVALRGALRANVTPGASAVLTVPDDVALVTDVPMPERAGS